MKALFILVFAIAMSRAFGQVGGSAPASPGTPAPAQTKSQDAASLNAWIKYQQLQQHQQNKLNQEIHQEEANGTKARLEDISHFRGAWSNQLTGVGLVTGLNGTGDSQRFTATQQAFANFLKKSGMDVDPTTSLAKNIAMVLVTADLPPYSSAGQRIDVTVSAVGDATSLQGGTLMFTTMKYPGAPDVYATAEGPISVGGFSVNAGGNSQSKGFVTVGRIPGGAIVQKSVPTLTVFNGKMFIDLDQEDPRTANRVQAAIQKALPEFNPIALNGRTIQVDLPASLTTTEAEAKLDALTVMTDEVASVVVNERTGTIVVGGNVRIGPCTIAKGSLSVKVEDFPFVSQPPPFSSGQTVTGSQQTLNANEQNAQVTVFRGSTTVADLAEIFQQLHLKASDIIDILQTMRTQGALKAKLVIE